MECPACGWRRPAPAAICARCGLIFARHRARPPVGASSRRRVDRAGRRAALAGAALGVTLYAVPPLNFLLSHLAVIIHELGHAAAAWLFGYPALPAFDFVYGGGVTLHDQRNAGLVVALYAAFGCAVWVFRRNRFTLKLLGVVGLVYTVCACSPGHRLIQLAAGHGAELLFAGIFLHRGLSGAACRTPAERPLYGGLAVFLNVKCVDFAWRLLVSAEFRAAYEEAKGGGGWMDCSALADALHTGLTQVAQGFLLAALLTPLAAWAVFRTAPWLAAGLARALDRHAASADVGVSRSTRAAPSSPATGV